MAKKIYIGLDVGNYDTKTQNTSTNSGYKEYVKKPYGADEVLYFNGTYYVPTIQRFSYTRDKTVNSKCLVLSLFGIAKEFLASIKDEKNKQKSISEITNLYLGVGLPPAHMSSLSEKLDAYYRDAFKNGIEFEYNDYKFNINLEEIKIYPQDYAAVATYNSKRDDFITRKFKNYYAIDIGGYTVDIVPIHKSRPVVEGCDSLDRGILKMYGQIVADANRELGVTIDETNIEDVLLGEATCLKQNVIELINADAQQWLDEIISKLSENGLQFDSYPVVFLGGGSKLFKKYIKENTTIEYYDFISDPKANAKGYRKLLLAEMAAR